MDSWLWFVLALLAAAIALALLGADRWRAGTDARERRRWAISRGWGYEATNPTLPGRWRHGALAGDERGRARNVATAAHTEIFDHEVRGQTRQTVAAVPCPGAQKGLVLELWLPSERFPSRPELEMLAPVGGRYAFATDLAAARPLIGPSLAGSADDAGDDVTVVWLENGWLLAAVPLRNDGRGRSTVDPHRLEGLLPALGALADELDPDRAATPAVARTTVRECPPPSSPVPPPASEPRSPARWLARVTT